MSYYDYRRSQEIAAQDYPFYALIMAAMRQADTDNTVKLKMAWPEVWDELDKRYHAPGGILPGEADQRSGGDRRVVYPDDRRQTGTVYDGSEGDQRIRDRRTEQRRAE